MITNPSIRMLSWLGLGIASILLFSCAGNEAKNDQAETKSESSYTEFFVAKSGSDDNQGTADAPFLTINKAAQIAMPGDTITVKEGIYREWVKPARGGRSESERITYRAAEGEDVRLMGSEVASDWDKQADGTWLFSAPDSFFGELNPFNTLSRHPIPVEQDESGDGWGWLKYGRWTHLGDVYIDGEGLTERETLAEILETDLSWYTETKDGTTSIWANFGELDPNEAHVEINSRPYAFFPETNDVNFITFKGFKVMNVASHWAPPVPYQPAAIGPNGGNHWIIEDNIILYAKAACISLGVPTGDANYLASGHHIVRNNVIMRCGQAGVMGQSWNKHSQIYGNHIESINYRKEFGGWETAAIKFHDGDGIIIRDNFVRGVHTADPEIGAAHGIWNDFRNSNWRVSNNIVMGAEANAILVEANWDGPNLYENNIFVGGNIATYSSRGDAWVHNMFINAPQKWENQPWGNRVKIANDRWMNNVFIGEGLDPEIDSDNSKFDYNVFLDGATSNPDDANAVVRTVTDTRPKVEETRKGITLMFNVDEVMRNAGYPIVTDEALDLDFSIDATVATDFYGDQRPAKGNGAGPFAKLQPGGNEFIIYEYSPLYKEAAALINQ